MHCEGDGKNNYKTLMALFPKSKVLKGLVSRSGRTACAGAFGGSVVRVMAENAGGPCSIPSLSSVFHF